MDFNWSWIVTLWFIFELLVRVAAFFIVPRNRKPSSATAWLLLILLFPSLGLLVFLLIGSPKLSKRRQRAQQEMNHFITDTIAHAAANPELRQYVHFDVPEEFQPFVSLNTELSKLPAFSGNKIELLPEYEEIFVRIAKDIDNAQHYVHIEFFIIALDNQTEVVFAAMERAVERGVKVRVLIDAIGAKYPNQKTMKQRMTNGGIEWHLMLPLWKPGRHYTRPDLRNHRKIIVIDGHVGYTGSLNLITRNYHRKDKLYYDELMARLTGPAALQLQAVFVSDWFSETEELLSREYAPETNTQIKPVGKSLVQIVPSGSGFEFENNLKLFNSLIYSARKRIVITNPYFVPDESLLAAIITAAKRGVEVSLLNSDIMDQSMVGHAQRSFYEELLKAGVKIYWYPWPKLLHSKHITIDQDICVIGSSNFDIRSFQLNLEISMVVYDSGVTKSLQKIEDVYISRSKLITLSDWRERSWHNKLLDNLARLTSALQ